VTLLIFITSNIDRHFSLSPPITWKVGQCGLRDHLNDTTWATHWDWPMKYNHFFHWSFRSPLFCMYFRCQIGNLNLPSIELGTNHMHRFRRWGYCSTIFLYLIIFYSQKNQNPAAEQRSSPQGCTVRPKPAPDRAR
jgi:hypothetical protein